MMSEVMKRQVIVQPPEREKIEVNNLKAPTYMKYAEAGVLIKNVEA